MSVTKKLSIFSIDKELIEKFDKIIPNNEKSFFVENFIRKFCKENPDKLRGIKSPYLEPNKRGRKTEVKT